MTNHEPLPSQVAAALMDEGIPPLPLFCDDALDGLWISPEGANFSWRHAPDEAREALLAGVPTYVYDGCYLTMLRDARDRGDRVSGRAVGVCAADYAFWSRMAHLEARRASPPPTRQPVATPMEGGGICTECFFSVKTCETHGV